MLSSAAIRVARNTRERHLPGEEGTWVFILGDMTVFAVLFGTYLYYLGKDPELFHASQVELSQPLGLTNTFLLLVSSLFVVTGVRALRQGLARIAQGLFAAAIAGGLGFVVVKYFEYSHHLGDGFKPETNDFWTWYYALTGLHLLHLLAGLGALAFIFLQSRKEKITRNAFVFIEGGACFWHFIDMVWLVLFPFLYLLK
jgi:nitric oxide reductase NorE protein